MTDLETDRMASAARLYYLDGLGQHDIAAILGVSRTKVSRLLTAARERGIVRISVAPYEPRDEPLERALGERFGLRHAVVVKAGGRGAESVRRAVGHFAAPVVAGLIRPRATIGVAGGRTIGELVRALVPVKRVDDVGVVQLMGHFDPTARRADAPEVGRTLAQHVGGPFFAVNAPAFVADRQTCEAFLAHEQIRQVWRRFEIVDLALVGIGTLEDSVFAERGVLDRTDYARLRELGAVGEICGRFFDRDGRECASEYRDRVISIDLDALRQRPEVVAVTNGASRRAAILAALRGRLITSLVIDDAGATALLSPEATVDEPFADEKGGPIDPDRAARSPVRTTERRPGAVAWPGRFDEEDRWIARSRADG